MTWRDFEERLEAGIRHADYREPRPHPCTLEGDHAHVLTSGSYSSYMVDGVFRDKADADALMAEIVRAEGNTTEEYDVECRPWLDRTLVDLVAQIPGPNIALHLTISCWWNGEHLHESEGSNRWHDRAELDGRWYSGFSKPCVVDLVGWESSYTLGVEVHVRGMDHDRVRKTYSEKRAELIADPAALTVKAWAEKDYTIPDWVWQRDENQPILAALEAARGGRR